MSRPEIIQSMTSVGGATAIMAESLTKSVSKCSQRGAEADDAALEEESIERRRTPIHRGTDCPLMIGYQFLVETNSSSGTLEYTLQILHQYCCIHHFDEVKIELELFYWVQSP